MSESKVKSWATDVDEMAAAQAANTAAMPFVRGARLMPDAHLGIGSTVTRLGVSPSSVVAWRQRFTGGRFGQDRPRAPRSGPQGEIPQDKIDEIVPDQETKPEGETHWSCRSMAKAVGVNSATLQRV